MGRIIGIGLIVLAIWAAAEVYTKGVGGAFGGLFGSPGDSAVDESAPHRAADAFQRAYDPSEERVDRQLRQGGAQE